MTPFFHRPPPSFFHRPPPFPIDDRGFLLLILERLEYLMATQAELATSLTAVTDMLTKIGTETQSLLAKIDDLAAALAAAGATTPEVDAALAALQAQAAAVDSLVPDIPA